MRAPSSITRPAGNFPQGTLPDMLEDVNRGIAWVLNNAHLYGGDPATLYLTGQSAGAQLGALALFAQVGACALRALWAPWA